MTAWDEEGQHGVGGQLPHRAVEVGRLAAVVPFVADVDVVDERRHDLPAVRVLGSELGAQRLDEHLCLHQLSVRGGAEVEVQRGGPGEVRRLDGADGGPAARARLQVDEALHLEEAQRLPQRRPADAVLLGHRRLERQPGAGAQAFGDDVADDVEQATRSDVFIVRRRSSRLTCPTVSSGRTLGDGVRRA